MELSKFALIRLYLTGFWHVFLYMLMISTLVLWGLQFVAILMAYTFDWTSIFLHIVVTLNFAAFYPGQTFWTYVLRGRDDRDYVIVGSHDLGAVVRD